MPRRCQRVDVGGLIAGRVDTGLRRISLLLVLQQVSLGVAVDLTPQRRCEGVDPTPNQAASQEAFNGRAAQTFVPGLVLGDVRHRLFPGRLHRLFRAFGQHAVTDLPFVGQRHGLVAHAPGHASEDTLGVDVTRLTRQITTQPRCGTRAHALSDTRQRRRPRINVLIQQVLVADTRRNGAFPDVGGGYRRAPCQGTSTQRAQRRHAARPRANQAASSHGGQRLRQLVAGVTRVG